MSTEVEKTKGPRRPRKVTKKVKRPTGVDNEYILALSAICMNTTIGPEGLCPSLLVFGAVSKIPLPDSLPSAVPLGQRIMMMGKARKECLKIEGEMKLKQAEKGFVPKSPST